MTKGKGGRPRLHTEGQPRPRNTQYLHLSFPPTAVEQWKAAAQDLGLSQSEMGQLLLDHRWVLELSPEEVKAAKAFVALSRQQ